MLTDTVDRLSTAPAAGQRRAIAVNLVVFFLFALTAVVFLTRTAVAANSINSDVASAIEPAVGGINHDTRRLPVLDTTARLTHRIVAAAKPLSGHLAGVVDATGRIKSNLSSTDQHVQSIHESVDGIKRSTESIQPAIDLLGGHVDSIHGDAGNIAGGFGTVALLTASVVSDLNGAESALTSVLHGTAPLNGSVRDINGTAGRIDSNARSIENSPILLRSFGNVLNLDGLLSDLLGGS